MYNQVGPWAYFIYRQLVIRFWKKLQLNGSVGRFVLGKYFQNIVPAEPETLGTQDFIKSKNLNLDVIFFCFNILQHKINVIEKFFYCNTTRGEFPL